VSGRKAFLLRVTPGLHRALERWAQDELRSVNAQIEYLLTRAVRQAGRESALDAPADGADDDNDASSSAADATGVP
jgi:hypothetical protein